MSKIALKKQYGPKTESHDEACHCEVGDFLFNVKIHCGPSMLHSPLRNRTANVTNISTHSPVTMELPITTARQRNEVASVINLY